jgi:hypothetical protein
MSRHQLAPTKNQNSVNPAEGVRRRNLRYSERPAADREMMVRTFILLQMCCVLAGCTTREDAARRAGRQGAQIAAGACADAGDVSACRAPLCRNHCASFADSKSLGDACLARCTGEGTCDSDADCAAGLMCVMIAPRVRRCGTPPTSTP